MAGLSRVDSGQCEKYYLKLKWYFGFSYYAWEKVSQESSGSETFVASGRTPKVGLSRVESGQCEKYYLKLKWYFEFSDKMSEKKFQESLKQLLLVGARQPKAGLSRVDAGGQCERS